MALTRQCELLDVNRATVYAHRAEPLPLDASELALMQLIDEEYTRHPFYGSRRMVVYLRRMNHVINRKRVQRLMGVLGLQGMAPGPNTSKPHPENKIYPYLLRGLAITRPNQVWSTDITYGTPSQRSPPAWG
uniref:Integrase, catalytic region n=1 Tax=mine drainage metagenome TaxID=410659 RepID=E6QQ67_9ZZZZ